MSNGKNSNLKIAIFTNSLQCGGAERVILSLSQGFIKKGFCVDLVLAKAEGQYLELLPPEVRLVDLSASGRLTGFSAYIRKISANVIKIHDVDAVVTVLPALISYLRKEKPTVLLSALEHANLFALLAKKISLSSTRIYISEHNTLSHIVQRKTYRDRVGLGLIKCLYPWADGVIAVSKAVASDLISIAKLSPEKVRVIYNPVVTSDIFSKAKEPLIHPWFILNQPPVILAVGRLTKIKDYQTLIRAFALIRANRPAHLMILGEGEERANLEALIREFGMQNEVLLPGFVQNPYAYMARAAVLVLSSLSEGFGNVLVEAMAFGTPVISTDCPGGPAEILEDGKWGKIVPLANPEMLASAIISTIAEKVDPTGIINRAKYFELDKISGEYLNVLLTNLHS